MWRIFLCRMIGPSSAVAADVREREQISAKTAAKVRAILHMDPFSSRRHRHILTSYIAARKMQTLLIAAICLGARLRFQSQRALVLLTRRLVFFHQATSGQRPTSQG